MFEKMKVAKDRSDDRFDNVDKQLEKIDQCFDGMEVRIVGSIRDLNSQFVKSQELQNERMDREFGEVNTKLEAVAEDVSKIKLAVVDMMSTDRHMHNLVGS